MSYKTEIYRSLENKMLRYIDLASVSVIPKAEDMVPISETPNLLVAPIDPNMAEFTGNKIYVRDSVARMLGQASLLLAESDPDLRLQVVYGYRVLSIQTALFKSFCKNLSSQYDGTELLEAAHRLVAAPTVAGHPTGGAIDLQIIKAGSPLMFGTKIWDFTLDSYTFTPFIDEGSRFNRQLLRRCMLEAGFAPFDGEWWHFSYGDREWARYYNKPAAMYEQIEFRAKANQ